MAKKSSNLDSGFLVMYDWLPALEMLPPNDAIDLLMALINRQRHKTPLPVFGNPLANTFARMIEPTIERRLYGQDGGNQSNENRSKPSSEDATQGTTVGTTQGTTQGTTKPSKAQHSKAEKNTDSTDSTTVPRSSPPTGSDVYAERFAEFWKAYPKKVGKEAARKAFMKVKPSAELLQRMLEAIKEQKTSDQWKRDNGQYIPNPATWLNQGRWDDETPVPAHIKDDMDLEEFFNGH